MKNLNFFLFLLLILLSACGTPSPAPSQAAPTPTLPAGLPASPTPTPAPSPTPPPTALPAKILVVSDPADRAAAEAAAAIGKELALPGGVARVEVISAAEFSAASLTAEVKRVVALVPLADLASLAAGAPQVTFVGLAASPAVKPAANLSILLAPPENQAYLAGFISAVISPDWRAAGLLLLPQDSGPLIQAFINGASYYCGRCTPIRGPIVVFPLVATTTPAGSSDALNKLLPNLPETVYIDAAVSSPELVRNVADHKLVALGSLPAGQAPDPALAARWAVTLRPDLLGALKTLWPDFSAGKGGASLTAGYAFSEINPQYFSPGRQRLAQDVINGLKDGSLAPLSPAVP